MNSLLRADTSPGDRGSGQTTLMVTIGCAAIAGLTVVSFLWNRPGRPTLWLVVPVGIAAALLVPIGVTVGLLIAVRRRQLTGRIANLDLRLRKVEKDHAHLRCSGYPTTDRPT